MKRLLYGTGGALVAAMALLAAQATPAAANDGKAIFDQKCASCHAMAPTAKTAIKEAAAVKGTPLWFAGSKFKKEWLQGWLAKPTPLLGVTWGTSDKGTTAHVAIPADEAAKVTDYLMTAVDAKMDKGKATLIPADKAKRRQFLTEARNLFEKHQGCFSCHKYVNKRGAEIGGSSAPTLVTAKDRLQADWILSFIQDPKKYFPNTKCPIPGEQAVNKFSDADRAMLAGYIESMGDK